MEKIKILTGITFSILTLSLASCSDNNTKSSTNSSNSIDTTNLVSGENLAESISAKDSSVLSYEDLVIEACELGLNSTVCIENYQTIVTTYQTGWGPGAKVTTTEEHGLYGFGSGVIYYKALTLDGDYFYKLITNEHVVSVDDDYDVVEGEEEYLLYDEKYDEELELELIGTDAENDIAVLSFTSSRDYSAISFANEEDIKVGSSVIAIGTPIDFAYFNTCTYGIVSKINESFLQHNATINSGNSGGPLFNLSGNLVGINNAKLSGNTSSGASIEGIYFAIPLSMVANSVVSITGVNDIVYA